MSIIGNSDPMNVKYPDKLTSSREGVLTFKGTPQYVIKQINAVQGTYVYAYQPDMDVYRNSGKEKAIRKQYSLVPKSEFKKSTTMGRVAQTILNGKKRKDVYREDPAIFVAPVEIGVGTFSGKRDLGFYERERESWNGTTKQYDGGDRTGIFILMSDVKWNTEQSQLDGKSILGSMGLKTEDTWYNL